MGFSRSRRALAAVVAGSLCVTATAAVASARPAKPAAQTNSWLSLGVLSAIGSADATCGAAAALAAGGALATQAGTGPGCVLPVADAAPVAAVGPTPPPPVVPGPVPVGHALAAPALLAAVVPLGVLALLLMLAGDDGDSGSPD